MNNGRGIGSTQAATGAQMVAERPTLVAGGFNPRIREAQWPPSRSDG